MQQSQEALDVDFEERHPHRRSPDVAAVAENVRQSIPRSRDIQPSSMPSAKYIGAIDQGTTSTRFIIFDRAGHIAASHQLEFTQHYPQPGWHEHDPAELLSSVTTCIERAVADFTGAGHAVADIATIGLTSQRETTVLWHPDTGEVYGRAIAWPDTRTKTLVRELKTRAGADALQERCGLPLSTYPSSVKLLWLLRHDETIRTAYEQGKLCFGTPDTWILWNLTNRQSHVTDTTNASRTMFMNLRTREYDEHLLAFFGLDRAKLILPSIAPSSHPTAYGSIASGPLKGLRITGVLGDQSAALVGQKAFEPGSAKNTYGTGCFLLYNVGADPVISTHGLLATVAYDFSGSDTTSGPTYALEGSIAVAGSAVKFLTENMGLAPSSTEITRLAESVPDSGGLVFVTAFSGLFAPYWIDDAKGTVFGITQHSRAGHLARATLEATCFQTRAILDAMEADSGQRLAGLAVDGGMSNSELCMQTQADVIGIPVVRPAMRETTSLGAAIAAGFATGYWKGFEEVKDVNEEGKTVFERKIEAREAGKMYQVWSRAVEMCRGWVVEEEEEEEKEEKEKDAAESEKRNQGKH